MKLNLGTVILLVALMPFICAAQQKKTAWPEMKTFHSFMASTFHPAEEGDLEPLKANADSLYYSALAWKESAVPANFKTNETKEALSKLVKQCAMIKKAISGKQPDETLKQLITEAHDTFHHIVGECRKADE